MISLRHSVRSRDAFLVKRLLAKTLQAAAAMTGRTYDTRAVSARSTAIARHTTFPTLDTPHNHVPQLADRRRVLRPVVVVGLAALRGLGYVTVVVDVFRVRIFVSRLYVCCTARLAIKTTANGADKFKIAEYNAKLTIACDVDADLEEADDPAYTWKWSVTPGAVDVYRISHRDRKNTIVSSAGLLSYPPRPFVVTFLFLYFFFRFKGDNRSAAQITDDFDRVYQVDVSENTLTFNRFIGSNAGRYTCRLFDDNDAFVDAKVIYVAR